MKTLYKITTVDDKTRPGEDNETQWGRGVTVETSGEGDLCGEGYTHWYTDPLLAVLLDPIHGDYQAQGKIRIWEGCGVVGQTDDGLKVGCTTGTTIKRVRVPRISRKRRVAFGILCALEVCGEPTFVAWAKGWLSGEDRSRRAEEAARAKAADAAWASRAATLAAWASRASAADAASAASAAEAAWAATAAADDDIDLIALAHKAITMEL